MAYLDICKSKRFNLIRLISSKGAWHLTGDQIQIKGMKRKVHAPFYVMQFKLALTLPLIKFYEYI